MKTIEAEELQAKVKDILHEVENGQVIEVARHGKVIAHLVPAQDRPLDRDANGAWSELLRLRNEISKYLPEQVDAVETVREIRREL